MAQLCPAMQKDSKGELMAYIECCGKKHKAIVFELKLGDDGCISKILRNAYCPICGENIVVIEKKIFIDGVEQTRYVRRQGKEADKLFDKLEKDILCQVVEQKNVQYKKGFFLNCNEYGKIKKCYSNLSALKLGLFDSELTILSASSLKVRLAGV